MTRVDRILFGSCYWTKSTISFSNWFQALNGPTEIPSTHRAYGDKLFDYHKWFAWKSNNYPPQMKGTIMWRNLNIELVHSPQEFATLDVAFPLLLARPHHRHCHARHHSRCQFRYLCSPLRCATPPNCFSRFARPPFLPSIPRPCASSLHSATVCQLLGGFCLVAYSDAGAPNPHCSALCRWSKPEVSEVETKMCEGVLRTLYRGGWEDDLRS